jgi:hypothetical protein
MFTFPFFYFCQLSLFTFDVTKDVLGKHKNLFRRTNKTVVPSLHNTTDVMQASTMQFCYYCLLLELCIYTDRGLETSENEMISLGVMDWN